MFIIYHYSMTTDIKVKIRDVEGLQTRITYIDKLRYEIEKGIFVFNIGEATDSLYVGYSGQQLDERFKLDVRGSTQITEDLYVLKDVNVGRDFYVSGTTLLNGDASLNEDLYVKGDTTLQGHLEVNSSSQFNDFSDFKKNVSIHGDAWFDEKVNVSGHTTLNSLRVNGSSQFVSNVSIYGDTSIDQSLNVSVNAVLNRLTVRGDVEFQKNVSVNGNTSLNNLTVYHNTSLNTLNVSTTAVIATLDVAGIATLNNATIGKATIDGLTVTGPATLNGGMILSELFVTGNSSVNMLNVSKDANIVGDLNVDKLTTLNNVSISGMTTFNGSMVIYQELRIGRGGSLVIENEIKNEYHNVYIATQVNVSNDGNGPAIVANQLNPNYADILLLEADGRDVFAVGDKGNTQILGKIRLGYDVYCTNPSVYNPQTGDILSSTSPFRDYQLDISGSESVSQNLYVGNNVSIHGKTHMKGLLTLENELFSYSDRRIKKNITPLEHCLDKTEHMHGYRYQRRDRVDEEYHIGLIAQEVESSFPELVTEISIGNDRIKTVQYQAFTGVLLECIHELKEKIIRLENKIFH